MGFGQAQAAEIAEQDATFASGFPAFAAATCRGRSGLMAAWHVALSGICPQRAM